MERVEAESPMLPAFRSVLTTFASGIDHEFFDLLFKYAVIVDGYPWAVTMPHLIIKIKWSEWRESNPRSCLGKAEHYHYATLAC